MPMKPYVDMKFTATMELSEAEVVVISDICSYGKEAIRKRVADIAGERFSPEKLKVLENLVDRMREETNRCVCRFEHTRKAFLDKE